jgi:5,10-methylenetetrahydromethanopterin reductase
MATEYWRMGATPVPATEIAAFARRFEEWGWDGMAVGEAHGLLPDPYVVLGQAAAATTTIKVGTAVAVPLRAPMLAAGAMATLQAVSGGRAAFSLGRGDGAMKVLKRGPLRVAEFDAYVRDVQAYLHRQEVDLDGVETSMSRLDDFDPSLALEAPPLNIAATGPKTIEVAARWADGVAFSVGADVDRLRSSIALAHECCERVGRDPGTLSLGCYVQVAVDDGDGHAREAIRGLVITHARFSGFEAKPVSGVESGDHERYRQAVETMEAVYRDTRGGVERPEGSRPGEFEFYPQTAGADELIDAFAIAGSAEYCAERLAEIAELGFERVYIGTRAVGVDLDEENTQRIGREVLALLR